MKKRFYALLITVVVASGIMMSTATVSAGDIPEPNCVCAYCGRPCGSGHAPGCPYYSEGGGSGSGGSERSGGGASFERAPIFVAPVGMVGGVFAGAVWYFKQMTGSLGDDFFIDSYQKYLSVPASDEWAAGSFTFGLRMGGLPWMALYVPTGPIRYGVASAYQAATKPSPPKPKPVDPNIAVYDLIAQNYANLSKTTGEELKKATGNVETAMMRRTRMLDEHIEGSQELREIKGKEGIAAARARAEKQLEAYSKARAEKKKLSWTLTQSIREKDAQLNDAINNANPASFFADLNLTKTEMHLEKALEDRTLPQGVQDSLKRELKYTKLLQNSKMTYDIGSNVVDIVKSYNQAEAGGKDAAQWIEDRQAREKVWRLQVKLLSVPLSGGASIAAGAAESAVDTAYAVTAGVKLGRQIDAEMATLEKLKTAQVFHDAMADDWDEVNISVRAAQANEETIRSRGDQYKKMQKENEDNAKRLRALGWKFE
ncbi:MAG: hypothetical protein ABFD70_00080 [Syntrophaceae bacterium]|nr:hypothetical protein [Deltaproteobacteria bacterium]